MTSYRVQPFTQFNFLIDLGIAKTPGPHGGFQEMSQLRKITGLNKATDVTLKRGVIAAPALQDWLDQIRDGHKQAKRTVTITMQNEDHKTVQKWKLSRARIIKHTSGPFNAKGTDVAIEELVLAYERLDLE
jgi:phage tail-like protein